MQKIIPALFLGLVAGLVSGAVIQHHREKIPPVTSAAIIPHWKEVFYSDSSYWDSMQAMAAAVNSPRDAHFDSVLNACAALIYMTGQRDYLTKELSQFDRRP